ncbi:MAG TPA: UDP-N-acetylmuramoyl-L-alanyl-D-glutamate--2,6-diaminopimelate ligase [Candidatus Saccharimonadales bacterium]|nr:UDP-N-acetylmuramoyl-L-alanyl-D-glutamate--2,6-diaminopimelate ligase [Candidatus Saccharimonadales bacterium]
MQNVKNIVKKLLPKNVRYTVANFYHLLVAVAANIRYGFPSHSAQVIMVTGTNGKTTTASMIAEMLRNAGHVVGINTTAYCRIGDEIVEKSSSRTLEDIFELQAMFAKMKRAGCEYIVLEATSMGLVQHRLWGVPCDVAVMTNLTQDHLDYHGTMERYAAAKGTLFERKPKLVVLNRDDEWFEFFNKFEADERKVTYGVAKDATFRIAEADMNQSGSDVKIKVEGRHDFAFHTNLPGKFNVYNATAAAAVGWYLLLEPEQIAKGLGLLAMVPGRMERVDEGQRFEVIVDYAHTPDALKNALETVKNLTKGKVWLVFGATGNRDKAKRPLMGKIAAEYADKIVLTDEEPYSEDPAKIRQAIMEGIVSGGGESKTTEVADRAEAIKKALTEARPRDTVIITGMGHEKVRMVGGKALPWSDVDTARRLLKDK